uniref:Uncharacterized protein n=1 Tax=Opuntia streptacantha TaxID=393608 RepID=A0A7C9CTX8_OPUST
MSFLVSFWSGRYEIAESSSMRRNATADDVRGIQGSTVTVPKVEASLTTYPTTLPEANSSLVVRKFEDRKSSFIAPSSRVRTWRRSSADDDICSFKPHDFR